jgi:hypothetical protein
MSSVALRLGVKQHVAHVFIASIVFPIPNPCNIRHHPHDLESFANTCLTVEVSPKFRAVTEGMSTLIALVHPILISVCDAELAL